MASKRKARGRSLPRQKADGAEGGRPVVAIVGRPNVGKSALFNRLCGSRVAIVQDRPGVTRDRLYADARVLGRDYVLVDTGGFDPESADPVLRGIAEQVQVALGQSDLVLCLFDGAAGALPADREAVELLRRSSKPVIYAANKLDNPARKGAAAELYSLGIPDLIEVSALHGHGLAELEQAMAGRLPLPPADPGSQVDPELPRVAIVGRPNAGKSSLVNRFLGEKRQLVDEKPGTTVDSVDTLLRHRGRKLVLVDTAGIRRQRSVVRGVESLGVLQALRALERCHLAVLMVDAEQGAAEQDTRIAGMVLERGRALVVALNKIDLLDRDGSSKAERQLRDLLHFAPWAPVQRISALRGRGIRPLMDAVRRCHQAYGQRVSTGEVNRFFEQVLEHHQPPSRGGRSVRLYYITQASTRPPTFVVSTNHPESIHFSYQRYVSNQLRKRFGFEGTPIRVLFRKKGSR
jgi:GTP-binding protein